MTLTLAAIPAVALLLLVLRMGREYSAGRVGTEGEL